MSKNLRELIIDLIRTDALVFFQSGPTVGEAVDYIDGLGDLKNDIEDLIQQSLERLTHVRELAVLAGEL